VAQRLSRAVYVFATPEAADRALAEEMRTRANEAVRRRGRFLLVLSGGRTPGELFRVLATAHREDIPWASVHFFWADERAVPPSHPDSNFGLATRDLLDSLEVPPEHVHRMPADREPLDESARRYEAEIRAFFADEVRSGRPTFDLVLLGVGDDGHTASLFPGAPAVEEPSRWVTVEPSPRLPPRVPRMTLTLPALARAAEAAFLVTGAEKRAVMERVLGDPSQADSLPAARVRAQEAVTWYLDEAAAPPNVPVGVSRRG
jgi:6-phosphogluconolactonase